MVKLSNIKGMVSINQLKIGSYLGRIWGNIGGMLAKPSGTVEGSEAAMSLEIHAFQNDVFVLGLCRDHKLRMWSASELKTNVRSSFGITLFFFFLASFDCVMAADVLSLTSHDSRTHQQGSQDHMIRKLADVDGKGNFVFAIFLCFAQHSQFCVVKPVLVDGQFQLKHVATVYAPDVRRLFFLVMMLIIIYVFFQFDLVDFRIAPNHLWGLWINADNAPILKYAQFANDLPLSRTSGDPGWVNVALEESLNPEFTPGRSHRDPRQAFLQQLFYPGRFSLTTLAKTVTVSRLCVRSIANGLSCISLRFTSDH